TLHRRKRLRDHEWPPRSLKRCSLPVLVLGRDGRNSIALGYLYGAIFALTSSCSSAIRSGPASTPSASTTNALTIWPLLSSGTPTTPHSATAGWPSSTSSTSGPAML